MSYKMEAFKCRKDIKFVVACNLTSVSELMFYSCPNLEEVYMPNLYIIDGAIHFDGTSAFESAVLTDICFPALSQVGPFAFFGCSELRTVDLPCCTEIGELSFSESGVRVFSAPNLQTVGDESFRECSQLTTLLIPSATKFGRCFIAYCRSLEVVECSMGEQLLKTYKCEWTCRERKQCPICKG